MKKRQNPARVKNVISRCGSLPYPFRLLLRVKSKNKRTFDGTSCYKLGTYYEEGRAGVTQDFSKAAAYYLKAVSDPNTHATMLGIPQAYYSLARFYENGLGVEKDSAKAKSYYEKALSACEETLSYEFAAGREAAEVTQKEAKAALERF